MPHSDGTPRHGSGELADFLQREGVLQAEYEQWRLALGKEGRASLATMKQIRTLEPVLGLVMRWRRLVDRKLEALDS